MTPARLQTIKEIFHAALDCEPDQLPLSTAEYNPCGWRAWLNNTTLSLGIQNVLDADTPFVASNFENGYDESLATIKGRFWCVQLKKRF
jgi:hypothetical protein